MPMENMPPLLLLFDDDGCLRSDAGYTSCLGEGNAREAFCSSLFIYLKLPKISFLSEDVANVIALTPITGLTSVIFVFSATTAYV